MYDFFRKFGALSNWSNIIVSSKLWIERKLVLPLCKSSEQYLCTFFVLYFFEVFSLIFLKLQKVLNTICSNKHFSDKSSGAPECPERVLRYFFEFRNFELQISERYITEKLDSDISLKRYMFDTSKVHSDIFSNIFLTEEAIFRITNCRTFYCHCPWPNLT
jgi:hypothetical protein